MLDGPTLGEIWVGNISWWNHTAIAGLNPNVTLPEARILLAYAGDATGAITQEFTNALSAFSSSFRAAWGTNLQTANWSHLPGIADHANNTGLPGYSQITFVAVALLALMRKGRIVDRHGCAYIWWCTRADLLE